MKQMTSLTRLLNKMTTRYIIDIPSNRVIFFTQDSTVSLRAGDSAIIYEDMFDPPEGMTLGNAWSWKLIGRSFKKMEQELEPPAAKTDIDTLEENKKEVIKSLNILINNARKVAPNPLNFNPSVRVIIQNELKDPNGPWPMCEALARARNISLDQCMQEEGDRHREFVNLLIRTEQWYHYYLKKINDCASVDQLAVVRDEMANRNYKVDLF